MMRSVQKAEQVFEVQCSVKVESDLDVSKALRACQVATMMNCDMKTVNVFVQRLRSTLHTDADKALLMTFADGFEMPSEADTGRHF